MLKLMSHFKLAGLLAGAALFSTQSAVANVLTYDGFTWGSVSATVGTSAPLSVPLSSSFNSGAFNVHVDSETSFQAWCMDIWQVLGGSNYTYQSSVLGATVDSGRVAFTQSKIDDLSRLATEAYGSVNNATTSAAFQAAAWEIAFESSGPYNLTSGAFTMTSPISVTQLATTWLNGLGNYASGGYSISAWSSATQQDILVFGQVSEPGTYTMLFAGLGLMGIASCCRKQTAKI